MEIGIISDIHGNLPALQAVLEEMPAVDRLICVGDIVGYNPWPAECVEIVRDRCSLIVQGNHDAHVTDPARYTSNEMALAGLEHAKEQLTHEQIEWLDDLSLRTTFADTQYKIVHSHPDPAKLGTYVLPKDFTRLRSYLDEHEGLVLGHTHVQHKAPVDGRLIVNPGSVGQPRDGNPDAAYAVLDTDAQSVSLHRASYNIDRVITKVEEVGLPPSIGARLLDGS